MEPDDIMVHLGRTNTPLAVIVAIGDKFKELHLLYAQIDARISPPQATPDGKYRVVYTPETGMDHPLPPVAMSAARAGMLTKSTPMLCPVHGCEAIKQTVTSHDGGTGNDVARYRFLCGCKGTAVIKKSRNHS